VSASYSSIEWTTGWIDSNAYCSPRLTPQGHRNERSGIAAQGAEHVEFSLDARDTSELHVEFPAQRGNLGRELVHRGAVAHSG
jgi:hypothetical protein